jgi:Dyp-type peroxidase family
LGVPQPSLDSFAPEFQEGMAARARQLGDVGESAPECWEKPLGSRDVHIVVVAVAPSAELLERALERSRNAYQQLSGLEVIWRQECYALPTEKEHFGFRDGISHPAVEGSGIRGSNPGEQPFKAGEFVLGYRDETGGFPPMPEPEVLSRNGTYAVFRKLHQRVAMFRQYLRSNSSTLPEEELLAAKLMGRWRSGAPLALSPEKDDPELGASPIRNNDFLYNDDPLGLKTPTGSHIRRTNPRDASVAGAVRLHRMIRRGTAYGPPLPEGVLEDDGADRGIMFVFIGSHIKRQFEFVQSEWVNDSTFIGGSVEKDPVSGANDGDSAFTIPRRPVRRRLQSLPRFVITRGGEYCFIPGLRALRSLADLES